MHFSIGMFKQKTIAKIIWYFLLITDVGIFDSFIGTLAVPVVDQSR